MTSSYRCRNDQDVSTSSTSNIDVLIVGAGPTGLVLALWLTQMGVRVRVVDEAAQPGTTSRALAVQARTLELYRQAGLADAVVARGRRVLAVNLWVSGKKAAHAVLGAMGEGISPFPYALVYPQDEHERLLIDRLAEYSVQVERRMKFVEFEDRGEHMLARLKGPEGDVQTCEARYIAGCDGANSTVRGALKIGFPGGVYNHLYYVADVEARGATMDGELHVALNSADFLAVFPLKDDGSARLVGTVRDEAEHQNGNLSWNDVSKRVIEQMRIDVERVNWFSTYRVHHRVAHHFGERRVFLLGDAAHIHSPVGGQGMNTGIGDAVNLAWKLAAVVQGRANESILQSYEAERIAFARRLVATTDRGFTAVTSRGMIARVVRLDIVPLVLPLIFNFASMRRFFFRIVSQTAVNYRGSILSEGHAGAIHGGDRLPWVRNDVGADNFTPLTSMGWQVHVYGDAAAELRTMCEARKIPLQVFPWGAQVNATGLQRNALYLVRPDGYVALADPEATGAKLQAYLDTRGVTIASS